MNAGAVITIDNDQDRMTWDQLLQAFGIGQLYELPGLGHPLDRSIKIESLADLANYNPTSELLVLAGSDGDFVQGDVDLQELEHPAEAIYIFGGTMTRLTAADVYDAPIPVSKVYISADGVPLFPSQAGAIVFWDRYIKRGVM